MRRNLPDSQLLIGKPLPQFPGHVLQECVDSGSNGIVFRAFNAETSSSLACKFIPSLNFPAPRDGIPGPFLEARKANLLHHPAVVRIVNIVPYSDPPVDINGVFLVTAYIESKNLRRYMKDYKQDLGVSFVESLLTVAFELLYELQQRNMIHGDLHEGNILVADPEYQMPNRPSFYVTDFGTHPDLEQMEPFNDYLQLASLLEKLLALVDYQKCEARDRFVYNILKNDFLGRHLTETNPTVDEYACNPRKLLGKLEGVDEAHRIETALPETALLTPFDYPNCEQIGNSHLLLRNLYSNRLLGLPEIQTRSNLVMTGPRGCGKTTVFRALSLDYLISTNSDDPGSIQYIGVYYRCDDLYFSFPRYEHPDRDEALDIPMHFLVVTLLGRLLSVISQWGKRHFAQDFGRNEEALTKTLQEIFGWPESPSPIGNTVLALAGQLMQRERRRAARKQRFVRVPTEPIEGYFGPQVLIQACEAIRSHLWFLDGRPIYFFVDDYSHPKITEKLQENLNRLLVHRSADVFFKISTESPVSFSRQDVDGKRFVETREYDLLNLGLRYISQDDAHIQEFLEDLFQRRFTQVEDYPVESLRELLGSMPRNENELARQLRDRQVRDPYAGVETICSMCSGDIHYMIRLVGNMVEDFGGVGALTGNVEIPRIPADRQNRSIRAAAGAFVESVRTLPRWGPELAKIVSAFGNVAHSYLRYENSKNEAATPPHQASRIEPFEPLELKPEAAEILRELLRYSILIEDPRGKSRRGKIVPRFYIRRYLIPHFQLTFSKRDSLQLESGEVELLLTDPEEFENRYRIRSAADALRKRSGAKRGSGEQEGLFDEQ